MKTLRGMLGGILCENQLMLVQGILKKEIQEKERMTLHSFVVVMSGSF